MTTPTDDRTDWDAVVVGAGPAGSLAAYRLAKRGHAVLLVDKARRGRPKVCGGCLGSVGHAALEEAGLTLGELRLPSQPLERVEILSRNRRVQLPLARRAAISRRALDAALLTAAEHVGVRVLTGCEARIESVQAGRRGVRLGGAGPRRVRGRLVLLAGGLGAASLLPPGERPRTIAESASRLGAGAILPGDGWPGLDSTVTMACGRSGEGYVGVARLPDGRLDVAAALNPAALPTGTDRLATLAASILEHNGLQPPAGWFDTAWRSTPSLTQRPTTLGAERVFLLGDAAGYVEPFTGEGIGWALRSALAVEPLAATAIQRWDDQHINQWNRRHAATIGRLQSRCRLVCRLIGARAATPTVVRALATMPWLARPVLRLIDPPQPAAA